MFEWAYMYIHCTHGRGWQFGSAQDDEVWLSKTVNNATWLKWFQSVGHRSVPRMQVMLEKMFTAYRYRKHICRGRDYTEISGVWILLLWSWGRKIAFLLMLQLSAWLPMSLSRPVIKSWFSGDHTKWYSDFIVGCASWEMRGPTLIMGDNLCARGARKNPPWHPQPFALHSITHTGTVCGAFLQ